MAGTPGNYDLSNQNQVSAAFGSVSFGDMPAGGFGKGSPVVVVVIAAAAVAVAVYVYQKRK